MISQLPALATGPWSDAFASVAIPRPRLSVSTWADRYRVIPRGTSPEPGLWRTSRVPYLREIMDAVSDPAVERVVVQAASQVGKSELLLGVIGYFAHQDPSPILFVQPTEIAMTAFSKERIEPMFRASPALAGKLSDSLRDKDNTILLKQFPGGYLACAWATSSVSLASRPIRVVLLDEVDRYPDSTGRDGDPIAQAIQRTSNFHNRKILAVSTPTIDGLSAISRMYEETDRRRLWQPCPRCGALQVLEWSGIVYKSLGGELALEDVHYRCAHCQGRIEERDRPEMLAHAEWRADEPGRERRGYQISALSSPWVRWRDLAEQWNKAQVDRDKRGLQEFVNLRLGEVWTEAGDQVHAEQLERNRSDYVAELPGEVLVVTAGVDVQDDRLEVEIVGWGIGRESWGVHYAILPGDTSTAAPWQALDALLARAWARADGTRMTLMCACVDSGGHRTTEVYQFCRERLARNVFAIKGYAGAGKPVVGKMTIVGQHRAQLYPVGVDTAKEALFSRLALEEPGPGYCHFPRALERGYDGEYFRGLCSERRVAKVRAGRRTLEWKQVYSRNEPLDCRNYATAAMELLLTSTPSLLDAQPPAPAIASAPPRRVLSPGVDAVPAAANGITVTRAQPTAPARGGRRVYSRGIG